VDEVNKAISQIDRATQQNAATVASLSGTAETLKEEARLLAETVNLFKVTETRRAA